MVRILRKLHRYAYLASVLFFFLLGYPFLKLYAKNPKKNYRKIAKLRRWISLAGMYTAGIRIKVHYEKPLDWNRNYIFCPNHTSILDITVLTFLCKQPFSFMGKVELLANPITRIFFETIDIPVKRDSKISSFKAYKRALELLAENKSLVIFPEGKIDDHFPPMLHPFKSGPFRLATENNIPIVPVVIQNAWNILWDDGNRFGSRPGIIHVHVLAPIATEPYGKENTALLELTVYKKMKENWDIYNKS
ncbi:lysophospholipid acyltransferase family protein [Sphingobacterium oryzagri]|uniref:Lysophospholipid acyltransferase family protein n=1 Tax=Sphingobacterium oryzagri TaxID=3025669 RepID=A0ABY7WEX5_9SPHI|nr:lysophospholipid acyltransferase family protein [Sphingobacterium sp. KACC 22765]WDF68087.1 lysophospholipid acyltransferase family protein [Sphingobacterium sp. KACC 22765]